MTTRILQATPFLAAVLLACVGCGTSAQVQTPDGFAKLEDPSDYAYRATSADNVVIAVRREKNHPKANLDFWAALIDSQLRNNHYMADGKSSDVRTQNGLPGRQMHYTREDQGRTYKYWVSVFVTDDKVFVVEAGGDEDRFKGATLEAVKKALASITIG